MRFFFLGTKVTPFGVISVVANKDLAGIQVDVNHLYAKGFLDVRTDAMYACRLAATGVHTGCIFFTCSKRTPSSFTATISTGEVPCAVMKTQ